MAKRKTTNDPPGPGDLPVVYLSIDSLERDPTFNRPVDERRAQSIADNFDPDKFGTIHVSRRTNGTRIIIDGQHRVKALELMGWNGQKIPCKEFVGLTKAQEAELFIGLNSFKAVRFIHKFLARIAAQEETACAINKIANQCGFVIDDCRHEGHISAAKALEDVYMGRNSRIKGKNPSALKATLTAIKSAWGDDAKALDGKIIHGVGMFMLRYGEQVDIKRLIDKLISLRGGPQKLINHGKGKCDLHGGNLPSGIGHYLTDAYNSRLRGSARLPRWRE